MTRKNKLTKTKECMNNYEDQNALLPIYVDLGKYKKP